MSRQLATLLASRTTMLGRSLEHHYRRHCLRTITATATTTTTTTTNDLLSFSDRRYSSVNVTLNTRTPSNENEKPNQQQPQWRSNSPSRYQNGLTSQLQHRSYGTIPSSHHHLPTSFTGLKPASSSLAFFSSSAAATVTTATTISSDETEDSNGNHYSYDSKLDLSHIDSIRILWGSQTGTAQWFAQDLQRQLLERKASASVSTQGIHEYHAQLKKSSSGAGANTAAKTAANSAANTANTDNANDRDNSNSLLIFLVSVTGVGAPPDNARAFYETIMDEGNDATLGPLHQQAPFAVFGLGNAAAHPNHYNVIGKALDLRLQELGGTRILPFGMGNDGGPSIEDDFDTWTEALCQRIKGVDAEPDEALPAHDHHADVNEPATDPNKTNVDASQAQAKQQHVTHSVSRSSYFPSLKFVMDGSGSTTTTTVASTAINPQVAFFQQQQQQQQDSPSASPFYATGTQLVPVAENQVLNALSGESGLREMRLAPTKGLSYESGDHVLIYPQNSFCLVQAYMELLTSLKSNGDSAGHNADNQHIRPHAKVFVDDDVNSDSNGNGNDTDNGSLGSRRDGKSVRYPHPTGISLQDTLTYCVDLGAVPSPSFVKSFVKMIAAIPEDGADFQSFYQEQIVQPHRTILDLVRERWSNRAESPPLSVEDVLYNLVRMKPRYYSIASSPLEYSDHHNAGDGDDDDDNKDSGIVLTYRPVTYVTSRGMLRHGVATNYLSHLGGAPHSDIPADTDTDAKSLVSHIPLKVTPNPAFRLPEDDSVPILMIAGGCGVAPIRAFLKERALRIKASPTSDGNCRSRLYLGFRSPSDQVYRSLIESSIDEGVLDCAKISYFDSNQTMQDAAGVTNATSTSTSFRAISEHSCCLVSDLIQQDSEWVWNHLDNDKGSIYVCGGARTFGAAMEKELLKVIQDHGKRSEDEARQYVEDLITSRRLCQDLAD